MIVCMMKPNAHTTNAREVLSSLASDSAAGFSRTTARRAAKPLLRAASVVRVGQQRANRTATAPQPPPGHRQAKPLAGAASPLTCASDPTLRLLQRGPMQLKKLFLKGGLLLCAAVGGATAQYNGDAAGPCITQVRNAASALVASARAQRT